MDVAFLIEAGAEARTSRNDLLRPFANSSLLEIALEKLSHLDAPCRKYVACHDRELKSLVHRFSGLTIVRGETEAAPPRRFDYLSSRPETWFCRLDPAFPLVSPETWWDAVELFLATGASGLVSVSRLSGRFFDAGAAGPEPAVERELLVENGAISIFPQCNDAGAAGGGGPIPFELDAPAHWGIFEADERAAVEAVYSMSQLGLYV